MIQPANLNTETVVASLRHIMPPVVLIDVGIGKGIGAMHQWRNWDIATAWLVEAESAQIAWAEPVAAMYPEWRVRVATLAESNGQASYYRASNPAESGLVATSKLTALWSNLHEEEHIDRTVTSLDTLLTGDSNLTEDAGWWLIVDCLPALRILQGASDTLERCSVLWLRTLLQPLPETEAGTTLGDLQAFLVPLGFRCVQVTEGNHPAIGDALFVRDWAQRLQPAIAELQATNQQCQLQFEQLEFSLTTKKKEADALLRASEAQTKIAETRQIQLDKLEAEKSELVGKLSAMDESFRDLTSKIAVLEKDRGAQGESISAAQSEKAAQAKLVVELQAQVEALGKENTELTRKIDALGKSHVEISEKLNASVEQKATTTDALEAAQAALTERTNEWATQVRLAADRHAKLEALTAEKADLANKFDVLTKTYAEHAKKLAASVQQQLTNADALKAAQVAVTACTDERDAQTKLATEFQQKIDALVKEKRELLGKAEAQIKLTEDRQAQLDLLIKEKKDLTEKLAVTEKVIQEFAERSEKFATQTDQLAKAHDEQARLATERADQLSQLISQRDNLNTDIQSLKSVAENKDATIANLNERITEQDHRERQLVEEIVRAEAQIELIKDLMLHERGQ